LEMSIVRMPEKFATPERDIISGKRREDKRRKRREERREKREEKKS
jgi:hypothetical protein